MQKVHCFHWRNRAGPRFLEEAELSIALLEVSLEDYILLLYYHFCIAKGGAVSPSAPSLDQPRKIRQNSMINQTL